MENKTLALPPNPLDALLYDLIDKPSEESIGSSGSSSSYYRSRLFTASAGVNLLVTAAQALLAIFSRLQHGSHSDDTIKKIDTALHHEIDAFSTRTLGFGYSQSTINIARFFLCTAINEAIGLSTLSIANQELSDEKPFEKHGNSENFFAIVNHLRKQPKEHLDLLELAYLILSLGYTGDYRVAAIGQMEIEHILDGLYQIIRKQRGDKLPMLLTNNTQEKIPRASPSLVNPQFKWLTGIILGLIFSLVMACNYLLSSKSHVLIAQFKPELQTSPLHR